MKLAEIVRPSADVWAGLKQGVLLGAATLVLTLPPVGVATLRPTVAVRATATLAALPASHRIADFGVGARPASADVRFVADWVADSRDNQRLPFAILDKREATVFVFDADAVLVGASPVLLGLAAGDDSVSDIGTRPIAQVRADERTTPAGRFVSAPGRNASGEDVVWVDYADSVSMHRVRPVDPKERRLERLVSPDPAQRRISYGCINIPVTFYDSVVHPVLGAGRAVVYVLPETRDVRQVFAGAYAVTTAGKDFPIPAKTL